MARITIDGRSYEVPDGKNILEAALSLGLNLPYFCWHPALGSVGACRQCAVTQYKNENDTRGKLVMSCMTPATEGTRISIEDAASKNFRASVIEWLMVNHPHDCPVCDEGGECHLQDMTVMTGHTYRRFRFKKRTYRNQDLGPFVNHEMNRCIACYRCVRFYRDYAGGADLNVFGVHDRVYFGRQQDGKLESEFSGNLVEVCPTGVFTDKTLEKHYARKWDLETAPSVCPHCSLGCNTIPGERNGTLRRVRNRYHDEINGYFICDRGRYGYEFVNSESRIRDAWVRSAKNKAATKVPAATAVEYFAGVIRNEAARTIGIGSPRASLESNCALRALVGPDRFYAGISDREYELTQSLIETLKSTVPAASLRKIEQADAAIVLGEDVSNTAPRFALALRQSAKGALWTALPHASRLDEIATRNLHLAPDEIARFAFALAHAMDPTLPEVRDLAPERVTLIQSVAETLLAAKRPVVVSGTGLRSKPVLDAAKTLALALHRRNREARISLVASEANSLGLLLTRPKRISEAFNAVQNSAAENVIILENDLSRRADSLSVQAFLAKAKRAIVLDSVATAMTLKADLTIPVASFAEATGTFVNQEGRAQRFFQVFSPKPNPEGVIPQESWKWIRDVMIESSRSEALAWPNRDAFSVAVMEKIPELERIKDAAPPASFRISGAKIAREPHRYSGRTAMNANVSVHEPKPLEDPDSPLSFSMEGFHDETPGWNSPQALNKVSISSAGVRLFESTDLSRGVSPVTSAVPAAFSPRENQWFAVPIHHIFGSEELSRLSPAIASLAPRPYVLIGTEDSKCIGIKAGEAVELRLQRSGSVHLPALVDEAVPPGVIGFPVGIPELEGREGELPCWCEITIHRFAGAA